MLSTAYPLELTRQLKAIHWNLSKLQPLNTNKKRTYSNDQEDVFQEAYIDLKDAIYARDVTPLLQGCTCHACRSHTRAYIHHLFICKELLGEVLLYTHNQHQLKLLFAEMRERLAGDRVDYLRWAGGAVVDKVPEKEDASAVSDAVNDVSDE